MVHTQRRLGAPKHARSIILEVGVGGDRDADGHGALGHRLHEALLIGRDVSEIGEPRRIARGGRAGVGVYRLVGQGALEDDAIARDLVQVIGRPPPLALIARSAL